MKLFKSREERDAVDAARQTYNELLAELNGEPERIHQIADRLRSDQSLNVLSVRERERLGQEAFRRYAETVLADDHLTEPEEDAFTDLANAVGLAQEELESRHRDLLTRLVIARANDGRLQEIEEPQLLTKKDELVHLEVPAALLKEVALREFRAGYSGVSLRIAKGVRYHVGGARGRSVVVGTQLVAEDTGTLTVTSQRAVFLGASKTMEFPYSRLLNIEVFTDGVRFHSSNRQRAPLFRVESGDVVAAILNGAVQRFNE